MSKLKFSLRAVSLLAGVALGAIAPLHSAVAGTVGLDYVGPQYGNYLSFGVAGPTSGSVQAGGFNMKVNSSNDPLISSPGSILAWCIELTQFINTPANYTSDSSGSDSWSGKMTQLFNQHYKDVLAGASNVVSAAMQLAVWEIAYDSSSLDLSRGNFRVTSGNSNARNMAQEWLSNLSTSSSTGDYKLVKLTSGKSQDLMTVVPTPIPAAALLFGSALGLGGLLQRRRRATPAAAVA
ncbi:hypothetical protein [Extensimonas perlucida]|uniref:hypothetical protein n=1 Tax=Extensimonas perlucida TaxID=2590786 RepID=UPI0011A25216|nr:hypothetical protein [Extensimonas perlucida]